MDKYDCKHDNPSYAFAVSSIIVVRCEFCYEQFLGEYDDEPVAVVFVCPDCGHDVFVELE